MRHCENADCGNKLRADEETVCDYCADRRPVCPECDVYLDNNDPMHEDFCSMFGKNP